MMRFLFHTAFKVVAGAGALFISGPLLAAELELVRDGKPLATIELEEGATGPEQYAAEELQRALRLMSGAELPIRTRVEKGGEEGGEHNVIVIRQLSEKGEGEKISVQRDGSALYLQGRTPREALYATYTFLQDTLGARWLWPGDSGEFLPRQASISVGDLKLEYQPPIPYRSIGVTSVSHGYRRDTDIWMARNRMNLQSMSANTPKRILTERKRRGFMLRIAGHNVKLPQEVLEANPEYAALFGGERRLDTRVPPQLCWSNPKVVELITEEIGKWLEIEEVDFASPYSADNAHFCECDACVAMGDVSTRWQKFSIQVIERLKAKHPKAQYMTLAYQAYRKPPEGPVAPYVNNGYCIYNGCYRHTYEDDCLANPLALKEITKWQELGGKMGIRGYEMVMFREPMFVPLASFMVHQAKWAEKNHLMSVMTESPPYGYPEDKPADRQRWASNRITYYATARAIWDPSVDTAKLVADWHRTIYGPAAKPMEAYYWAMEKAWRATPGHITYFLNPAASYANGFITQGLVDESEILFAKAREAAQTIADEEERGRVGREIGFEQTLFGHWKELFIVQQGRQERMTAVAVQSKNGPANAPAMKADPNEALWQQAPTFPEFEDTHGQIVKEQTEVRALWDSEALYLRFICHHQSPIPLKALFKHHDEAVYGDDSVEIFFNPDASMPAYMHLVVNSLGVRLESRSEAGMNLDKNWNGEWSAVTHVEKDRWIIDVKLPFSTFGISPKEGAELAINFTRTRPGRQEEFPSSGWPDSSNHNPSGYGRLLLLKEAPKPLVLYAGEEEGASLLAALVQKGLHALKATGEDELGTLLRERKPGGVILRYPWKRGAALSPTFLQEQLLPYLKEGGRVLVVARGPVPLSEWFPEEDLAVQWNSEPFHPVRKVAFVQSGSWLAMPNEMEKIFAQGTTPGNGLRPLSTGWEVLARFRLKEGGEVPFLLRKSVGQGELFLTSSWLGFGGRHEIFGDANSENAAKLVENLFAASREG